MNFKRLLTTPLGQMIISILLGIGLATLFHNVCKDKNCIVFNGPVISNIEGKTYKYNEKCYKYTINSTICSNDNIKKIIDITEPTTTDTTSNNNMNTNEPFTPQFIGM